MEKKTSDTCVILMVDGTLTMMDRRVIFQLIYNTFSGPAGDTETIIAWKSRGLPNESIKPNSIVIVLLQNRNGFIIQK